MYGFPRQEFVCLNTNPKRGRGIMVSLEIQKALNDIRAAEAAGDDLLVFALSAQALQSFPDSPEVSAVRASHLSYMGHHAEAQSLIEPAKSRWPDSAHILAVTGRIAARLAQLDTASEYARQALARNNTDPWVLESCIDVYVAKADNNTALSLIRTWREVDPNDILGAAQEIVILGANGMAAESEAALQAAEARWPTSPQLIRYRARTLLHSHKMNDAVATLRRCVELAPNSCLGWSELSSAVVALGQLPESEQAALRALAINPACVPALNRMAYLCAKRGQQAEAAEWRRKSQDALPILATMTALGPAADALRARDWGKVLDSCEPAVSSPVRIVRKCGLIYKSRALIALSRFKEAEGVLDDWEALSCGDSLGDVRYFIGRAIVATSHRDQPAAISALRAGLDKYPSDGELKALLLPLLRKTGQTDEVKKLCEEVIENPPDAVWGYWALIIVLYNTENWQAARALLRTANIRFPDCHELRLLNTFDRLTRRVSQWPIVGTLVRKLLRNAIVWRMY
jgi:tetratricopeptide (TPR) repeat protein